MCKPKTSIFIVKIFQLYRCYNSNEMLDSGPHIPCCHDTPLTFCFILAQLGSVSRQRLWMVTLQAAKNKSTGQGQSACRLWFPKTPRPKHTNVCKCSGVGSQEGDHANLSSTPFLKEEINSIQHPRFWIKC